MPDLDEDLHWMRRALKLAAKGYTAPNPMVGCCIVRDGKLVGEGYHTFAGQPHAEAAALAAAGANARSASVYVTLEPCSHWGRTPPCAEALIAAGVSKVILAAQDSNPKVGGKGTQKLLDAGISVRTGLLESQARKLNEDFFHFHETKTPFFVLKSAVSLDGKTATRTGDSRWISGEKSRELVHQMRAKSSAVMTGVGTILADDSLLTARFRKGTPPRQPLRIILDSHLRTPSESKAVKEACLHPDYSPLLIVTTKDAPKDAENQLTKDGVEVLRLESGIDGKISLRALEKVLYERQVVSVLVEGGGKLNSALIKEGIADKIVLFVAPKLIGGESALTFFEGCGAAMMADSIPVHWMSSRKVGEDIMIEAYLNSQTKETRGK